MGNSCCKASPNNPDIQIDILIQSEKKPLIENLLRNNDIPEKSKPTEIKSAKNLENNSVEDPKIMKEVTSLEQIKDISNDAKINPKDLEGRKMSKSKIPTDEKTKQNQSRLNTNKVKNTLRNNL